MMMSDLPADLVEEILSRVPATSLKPLRSTCKRWKALFKTPRFVEKHFRNAPKQSHVVMLMEYRLFPMNVDLNVVPPSIEFKDALDLKDSRSDSEKQVNIVEVFHCDGLLLCITDDKGPVVCNPYLGERRWIQQKYGYNRDLSRFALGYENNKSGRSYKILMYWECGKTVGGFEIYEFCSDSWRVVNAPNCIRTSYRGVALKGNTYCTSTDVDNDDKFLLSFDFTGERFRRLCLPRFMDLGGLHVALSVVREEKLSVLHHSFGSREMEMWVTNKIDTEAELSWSKSFAVDLDGDMGNCLLAFTCLLIDEEKKVALCCSTNKNRNMVYTIGEDYENYTEISYMKKPLYNLHDRWWPFIFNYVPSLFQIQSN